MNNDVYWYRRPFERLGPLSEDSTVDVVIVGGGLAGLSCAQVAREAGLSVAIVERDFCGGGASGKSAGFVLSDTEVELHALRKRFGPERAKKVWDFSIPGIEAIRSNIVENDFSCEYQEQDAVFAAISRRSNREIDDEYATYRGLHFEGTLLLGDALMQTLHSGRFTEALRSPGSFGINPFEYARALTDLLVRAGVRIFEQTPVTALRSDGVETPHGTITAKNTVVCADRFIPELGSLKDEIYHVQTFLGVTKPLSEDDFKKIFPGGPVMVWDTDLVYTYFRPTPERRIVIGGGDMLHTYEPHLDTHTEHFARKFEGYLRDAFPGITFELETVWPGMIGVSKDLLPVMGPDAERGSIWYAGAATGLSWATALGRYAAQHIIEGRSDYDAVFAWDRSYEADGLQRVMPTPATFALCNSIAEAGL